MPDPLEIVGVDEANVGRPSNDGSPGSGLYPVPIKLSRAPSAREAELLAFHWDNPPQFTTMHRPGTADVSGSNLVLSRTTIDEVKEYHAKTLRLVVDAVNDQETRLRAQEEAHAANAESEDKTHRRRISDVAKEIEF